MIKNQDSTNNISNEAVLGIFFCSPFPMSRKSIVFFFFPFFPFDMPEISYSKCVCTGPHIDLRADRLNSTNATYRLYTPPTVIRKSRNNRVNSGQYSRL